MYLDCDCNSLRMSFIEFFKVLLSDSRGCYRLVFKQYQYKGVGILWLEVAGCVVYRSCLCLG